MRYGAVQKEGQEVQNAQKETTAYRTISEVADELDLAPHVLRFWETKFTVIQPLKRQGGRRFYRPEDIATIRTIKTLLYDEGMTIKGAQTALRADKTPAAEKRNLARQSVVSAREILSELQDIHSILVKAS